MLSLNVHFRQDPSRREAATSGMGESQGTRSAGPDLASAGNTVDSRAGLLVLVSFISRQFLCNFGCAGWPLAAFAILYVPLSEEKRALGRFPAKACPTLDAGWISVRAGKTRQMKKQGLRSDSAGTEKALDFSKARPRSARSSAVRTGFLTYLRQNARWS